MTLANDALFEKLNDGMISFDDKAVTFINGQYHPFLNGVEAKTVSYIQYFKPHADVLAQHGFEVSNGDAPQEKSQDIVIILTPKSSVEARYWIARGASMLRQGGVLICAAENKAGGTRLKKMLAVHGLGSVDGESRNKSRVVWGYEDGEQNIINQHIQDGAEQNVLGGQFLSQPGVFGWNKVDKGSELLVEVIPHELKGCGADFGCGYGYLSEYLLRNCSKIKNVFCADADYRAVKLTQDNLARFENRFQGLWVDLTLPHDTLKNLDFIVMNPPFHEGKKTDSSIGTRFIENAYDALRQGGKLWMVANTHLPYERILSEKFEYVTKHHEGQGYKVYEAVR